MQYWTIHSYQLCFQFSEWITVKGNNNLDFQGICTISLEVLEDGKINKLFPFHFHQISWITQMKLFQNKNKSIPIKLDVEQCVPTSSSNVTSSSSKKNKTKKEEEKKPESQTFALVTANQETLSRGKYVLEFQFKNQLRESHHNGIFYVNSPNNLFVLTHFEPNFARTAFPCVDAVEHKATFSLQIQFPLTWIQNTTNLQQIQSWIDKKIDITTEDVEEENSAIFCISNTRIKQKQLNSSKTGKIVSVQFEETPLLPTYLLAFTVGNYIVKHQFTYKRKLFETEDEEEIETTIRFIYPNIGNTINAILTTQDFKRIVQTSLDYVEQFLMRNYTLNKLDFCMVPKLSLGGGMENHGCIFLLDPLIASNFSSTANTSTSSKKQYEEFVELIIHEIMHLFFGNYTSFPFWVKEGLAQFFEKFVGDMVLGRKTSSIASTVSMKEVQNDKISKLKNSKEENLQSNFSNHFNGVTYGQAFEWVKAKANELGIPEFKAKLKAIVDEHKTGFVREEDFIKYMTKTASV